MPYVGLALDGELAGVPEAAALMLYDGREAARSFTASGATKGNAEWEATGTGELNIESQRNAYLVIRAGLVAQGAEREQLLALGLDGIAWGLAQQGVDGSFPQERGGADEKSNALHPKSEFLDAAAFGLLAVSSAPNVPQALLDRVATLRPALALSARWMAQSQDLIDFFANEKNTNQLLFVAVALHGGGVLLADDHLLAAAEPRVQQSVARMTADGTLPEAGGFDSSYQAVSLELIARFLSVAPAGELRDGVFAAEQRATDRFLAVVAGDGAIWTGSNTRTEACRVPITGPGPKGKDVDVIPFRMYQIGRVLGTSCVLDEVGRRIELAGQGFDHIGC